MTILLECWTFPHCNSLLCVKVSTVQGSFGCFHQHAVELSKTLDIFIDSMLNFVQPKFEM